MATVKRQRIATQAPEPEVPAEEVVLAVPRPPMRADHTDARQPQHEPNHEKARVRTRQKKDSSQDDVFYIPQGEIPEGSSYEWKRFSVNGLEDPFYLAQMRQQGWEPVDPKRHPNWVPPGYNQPHIIKGGQILMERPSELTEEARKEQRTLSRTQMREAEQRLGLTPKDTGTRDLEQTRPRVVKEIGRMIPIED